MLANETLARIILDAIPAYVFIVDSDIAVYAHNSMAGELTLKPSNELRMERAGNAMRCVNSSLHAQGCGHSEHCQSCLLRSTVAAAYANGRAHCQTRLQLKTGDAQRELYVLITASLLTHEQHRLALLIIEDIGNIIELQKLIPICGYCKRVRDDASYWSNVDTYLKNHLDLNFSHGICPSCFEKQKAEFLASKAGRSTRAGPATSPDSSQNGA